MTLRQVVAPPGYNPRNVFQPEALVETRYRVLLPFTGDLKCMSRMNLAVERYFSSAR